MATVTLRLIDEDQVDDLPGLRIEVESEPANPEDWTLAHRVTRALVGEMTRHARHVVHVEEPSDAVA